MSASLGSRRRGRLRDGSCSGGFGPRRRRRRSGLVSVEEEEEDDDDDADACCFRIRSRSLHLLAGALGSSAACSASTTASLAASALGVSSDLAVSGCCVVGAGASGGRVAAAAASEEDGRRSGTSLPPEKSSSAGSMVDTAEQPARRPFPLSIRPIRFRLRTKTKIVRAGGIPAHRLRVCARAYNNEKEKLFDEAVVKREDLFITSKLWCGHHAPEDVPEALGDSLSDLQLEYLDLYLRRRRGRGLRRRSGGHRSGSLRRGVRCCSGARASSLLFFLAGLGAREQNRMEEGGSGSCAGVR
ncbi:uncharacterized protein LOC123426540 isoform X2 [Hordeum vulgare subsp. vulgare]|uniref:uncharacterized protein LOC123426540 isoform X2 n=1 Tax=Hordeum vulgare subsp. vulgare TaxID=112509 RepID=UPI001D1A5228|nr:uncharacterized protein LOC123426540 isoform X2 [Hordeum vulgare subsp. vulgare]